jgi:hypothetical protein
MAALVTTVGAVTCQHGGSVQLSSQAGLTVDGKPVVLFSLLALPASVYAKCTLSQPCVATTPQPPPTPATPNGNSTKLTVGGEAVLLDSLVAISAPVGTSVSVMAGQSKLTAS